MPNKSGYLTIREIDTLVRFHYSVLTEMRGFAGPGTLALEQNTIKALGELRQTKELEEKHGASQSQPERN